MAKKIDALKRARGAASVLPPHGSSEPATNVPIEAPKTKAEATAQIERLIRDNKRALDALAKL